MKKDFWNDKNVLITGASSGIGKAVAQKLTSLGARLYLIARRIELMEEFTSQTDNVFLYKCDVSDKTAVIDTFDKIITDGNEIDIALLNSGISLKTVKFDFSSVAAEKIFGVNFFGTVYWAEKLIPYFLDRKKGIFAAVGSLADTRGYPASGFYSGSKAALKLYLESISVDLKNSGVKIITIRPGFVKTPMTDKNNFAMPFILPVDKSAEYIIDGLEKGKRYINFPLPTLLLSTFIGLIPASLYEFLASNYKPSR